jgi:hypothetical protein
MDVLDLARLLGVLRRQRRVGFISEPIAGGELTFLRLGCISI